MRKSNLSTFCRSHTTSQYIRVTWGIGRHYNIWFNTCLPFRAMPMPMSCISCPPGSGCMLTQSLHDCISLRACGAACDEMRRLTAASRIRDTFADTFIVVAIAYKQIIMTCLKSPTAIKFAIKEGCRGRSHAHANYI
jgi:hypothetical protein